MIIPKLKELYGVHTQVLPATGTSTLDHRHKRDIRSGNLLLSLTLAVFFLMIFIKSVSGAIASSDSTKHWVGTWACAPYKAESHLPPISLSNNSIRQIVRVSIEGDTIRVKFSNITFEQAITIQKVTIAKSPDGTKSAVDVSTITELAFDGKENVTIDAKSEIYSDPVAFDLDTSMRVAITIYYGQCASSGNMTFHWGSRGYSYFASGDKTSAADFSGAKEAFAWYTISTIDVLAPKSACCVAAIGNSITDGAGLDVTTCGMQNRWTDRFSEALLANEATKEVGVINLGIGATNVTSAGNGAASGVDRFKHDVLEQSGLKWVIIFYGVNDLAGGVTADGILAGIKKMADQAHAKDPDIKVYGATITPFQGYSNGSYTSKESAKNDFNSKLPNQTYLDGVLDFAEAIADPNNPSRMLQEYRDGGWNDGLHPGPAGHEAIGKSIDLEMFTPPPVKIRETNRTGKCINDRHSLTTIKNNSVITFDLPEDAFVSCKVFSLQGKTIAELAGKTLSRGHHTLSINNGSLAKGVYPYSLTSDRAALISKGLISLH